MKHSQLRFLGAVVALVGTHCVMAPVFAQDKTKLSIGLVAPPTSAIVAGTAGELQKALEATGKAEVTLYGPGSPYSTPNRFTELVSKGVIDFALSVPQFEAGRYPLNLLIGEPLVASHHETGTRAYYRVLRQSPELQAEFKTVRVVNVCLISPEQIHSRRPLKGLDDLKGMRVLATNPGVLAILRQLGADTVALPFGAHYENLQKGVADANSASWTSLTAFRTYEVTSYHLQADLVHTPVYLLMNEQRYAALIPELRKVVDDFSTEDAAVRLSNVWTRIDQAGIEEAKKRNHEIVVVSKQERDVYQRRFRPLTDARIAELEKKGLPARKVFDAFVKAASDAAK